MTGELVRDEDHRQAEVAADLLEQGEELGLDRDVESADTASSAISTAG